MKNIQRDNFLLKILAVLSCICLTACGRHDYSPAVHGGLKTSSKQEIKGETSAFISIRTGDTLYGIAKRYGIPIRKLIEVNRLRPPYMIYPGSKLKTAVTGKVKPGSKAAGRRKSFCARSKGWTGERGKAARRRWKC